MRWSIELWARFVWYAIGSLLNLRSPRTVVDSEFLAKALFSGHVKKDGVTLKPNAFLINAKSEYGISVHRWSLAPSRLFNALGVASALRRGHGTKFYGFAQLLAGSLSAVVLDDGWRMKAIGVPTRRDPFHADIPLPPDREKDYYLFVATELLEKVKPKTIAPT